MADDNFQKPQKIEFDVPDQDSFNPQRDDETPLATEFKEIDDIESTAAIVVEEYGRTIEFMKFVEQLLRDLSKVEVDINPEDDPEVWMAMNRIFANPDPKLNQDAYFQVIDALEVIERIEQVEDRSDDELEIPDTQEVDEGEIKDEDFRISAKDEIEEKSKVRRSSVFKDPPPPPPPQKPPESIPWKRRFRKLHRIINVLGKSYKIQWLRDRWWDDRRRR